ncbi:MAG TPA: zinc ribbon domain-containing protein [Candidatus Limnocylindria bacterium]|jgi:hypothetical protein|nr:zinc ribbon domain-containing protein [Candidatus Limnocylindria bacterium]
MTDETKARTCPFCGGEVDDTDTVCPHCGESLVGG